MFCQESKIYLVRAKLKFGLLPKFIYVRLYQYLHRRFRATFNNILWDTVRGYNERLIVCLHFDFCLFWSYDGLRPALPILRSLISLYIIPI